ncbi:MbtH family protein [Curvivirga sp.]|uniref:MbtH family protein n=1 Tax=Curvivirga sp. TaxID=2856848 RepID=UPI003B5A78E1
MFESGVQNPFDDNRLTFLALKNGKGEYSLWPEFKEVPTGWDITFGPAERDECLAHINAVWVKPLTSVK